MDANVDYSYPIKLEDENSFVDWGAVESPIGEKVSQTEWHNIVAWRGLAEIAEKYLKKGAKVYIEGKLKTRTWQDKDGNNRYSTEVITDNLTMLGSTVDSMVSSIQEKPIENESKSSPEKEFSSPDENDDLPF